MLLPIVNDRLCAPPLQSNGGSCKTGHAVIALPNWYRQVAAMASHYIEASRIRNTDSVLKAATSKRKLQSFQYPKTADSKLIFTIFIIQKF